MESRKRGRRGSANLVEAVPAHNTSSKKAKAIPDSEKFGTNDYNGWTPQPSIGDTGVVDRVALSDLSPRSFFDRYVMKRRPVVIVGTIQDGRWKANVWDLNHISQKAGECLLKIEYREHNKDRYGQAKEVKMRFGEFLDGISKGDDLHYLTTQDLVRDEEGRPEIIAPPLTHLLDEFPLRPELMGKLVPANINLWLGNSADGSVC